MAKTVTPRPSKTASLKGVSTAYLTCRTEQHLYVDSHVTREGLLWVQHKTCARCTATTTVTFDNEGYRLTTRPRRTYPEGYIRRGWGRTTVKDLARMRVELFKRVTKS